MEDRKLTITTLRRFELRADEKSYAIFYTYLSLFLICAIGGFIVTLSSPWLATLFWFPLFIFFCKFFIFVHDCEHFSLFKSRSMNRKAGAIFGFFILLPSVLWKKIHDSHHGVTGNLDERENNPGLSMKTVKEFLASSGKEKRNYRFMTNIYTRLLLLPIIFLIAPRIPLPRHGKKVNQAIIFQDFLYLSIITALLVTGTFTSFILLILPPLLAFYIFASMLFFLQHQYEDTYWAGAEEWDLYTASLQGSSYIKFKPFMAWLTGNVGCHHIHHLNPNIPYFDLKTAAEELEDNLAVKPVKFSNLFHDLKFVLWDDELKKAVTIKSVLKK